MTISESTTPERDQQGVIAVFCAVIAVALFLVAGSIVDFGRALAAQRLAVGEAEQAARTGAGQISVKALRQGRIELNQQAAVRAATNFTVVAGHPGIATADDSTVTVRIVESVPTTILDIIHISEITVTASESAVDVAGISEQDNP
jgi:Flp pilus assembly protein TadG